MGKPEFVERFDESGRFGFYLRVLQEGTISAGNKINRIRSTNPAAITVAEFVRLYQFYRARGENISSAELRRILSLDALPDSIKDWLRGERERQIH
jgi:MOSC domain-containing protein YiiM